MGYAQSGDGSCLGEGGPSVNGVRPECEAGGVGAYQPAALITADASEGRSEQDTLTAPSRALW